MVDTISRKEFTELTRCLLDLPVSHAWRSGGSAIFLELGKLTSDEENNPNGEATFMLEFDWRVEKLRSIYFGSTSGNRKIANGLRRLTQQKVTGVEVEGRLPELILTFSGNLWLRTFTLYEPQPMWTIFLPSGKCLSSEQGKIKIELCGDERKKSV